jgi:hypothetical protein
MMRQVLLMKRRILQMISFQRKMIMMKRRKMLMHPRMSYRSQAPKIVIQI